MKKNSTPRCSHCTYLIFSKKKVKKDRHIYHLTCYKRMSFDNKTFKDMMIEDKNELCQKDTNSQHVEYGESIKSGEAIK